MSEVKYVPSCASGKSARFGGYVLIDPPTIGERYSYRKRCRFETNNKGEYQIREDDDDGVLTAIELSEKHVKKVDIKRKEDGKMYKSFLDLSKDFLCEKMLGEIAVHVVIGFPPSKNSKA
jgi:hypothetical protein